MGRKLAALALAFVLSVAAFGKQKPRYALRDGLALSGLDGKLIRPKSNDIWFFEFDADLSDDKGRIKAGTAVEVLPSSALEKVTAGIADKQAGEEYRLWGRLTRFRGKNYIFGIYFLPVGKVKQIAPAESKPQENETAPNDPNDPLTLPPEIMKRLRTRRVIRTEQLRKPPKVEHDSILANRTGYIVRTNKGRFRFAFEFDALGRNLEPLSIVLLPCEALAKAWRAQDGQLDPPRFKIAAVVTRYKGKYYLLAQQATRVYSYGNFPR